MAVWVWHQRCGCDAYWDYTVSLPTNTWQNATTIAPCTPVKYHHRVVLMGVIQLNGQTNVLKISSMDVAQLDALGLAGKKKIHHLMVRQYKTSVQDSSTTSSMHVIFMNKN